MNEKAHIEPLADFVLVRPHKGETRTSAGIIKPEGAASAEVRIEVVAIGPGRVVDGQLVPVGVSVGDFVIIIPNRPMYACDDRGEYALVSEQHLAGVDRRPLETAPALYLPTGLAS